MKGIKQKEKKRFSEFDSEFISLLCLLGVCLSFIGGGIDYFFESPNTVYWEDVVFLFVFLGLYFWGKKTSHILLLKSVVSVISIGYADYLWATYYGSYGPAVYFFIAISGLLVFIWTGKQLYFGAGCVLLNILLLFFIDYTYPKFVSNYSSYLQRVVSVYTTLIMYCALVLFLVYRGRKYTYTAYKRAVQYDRLKTTFIANISHEVRTPMNAIIGFSRLLEDSSLSEDDRKMYVQTIVSQGNNLMSQMEGLVDISKIESEDILVTQNVVNLNDLIVEVEHSCLFLKKNEVEIRILVDAQFVQHKIRFDAFHFRKILSNLLSNALKNTFFGTVEISCRISEQDVLLFRIKDTGIGIPKEEIKKIFDRFYQIDRKDKQVLSGGMGLGLAICRSLLDAIEGRIWVDSEEGKGSIFYFEIPFRFETGDKLRETINCLTEEVRN
jgi:signal transduction histidine kinase